MPTYIALTFTPDVDWTQPEHAAEMKEYVAFGQAATAVVKGGHALYPTATATVRGGKGGDVLTATGRTPRPRSGRATAYRTTPAAGVAELPG